MWLVNFLFWLQAFISPVILMGIAGLAIGKEMLLYILLFVGAIAGIIIAEYIRRRIGLSVFFSRIYGPNEMDRKKGNGKKAGTL